MKLQNLIHILIGIACIGLLPGAQAVSPPPDGGYPGGNTAEGQNALGLPPAAVTIPQSVGIRSLPTLAPTTPASALERLPSTPQKTIRPPALRRSCSTLPATKTRQVERSHFIATPLATSTQPTARMRSPAILPGRDNTASGAFALSSNTIGVDNMAIGYSAPRKQHHRLREHGRWDVSHLQATSPAGQNTATGESALQSNTIADDNTANGAYKLSLATPLAATTRPLVSQRSLATFRAWRIQLSAEGSLSQQHPRRSQHGLGLLAPETALSRPIM